MKENEDDDKEFVRKEMEALEKEMDLEVRKCPKCGDFIPPELNKCSNCGYVLVPSEEEKMPEFDDKYPEEEESEDELELEPKSEELEEPDEEKIEIEEEVAVTDLKEIQKLTESKTGKIIAVVVILIGIISYLITPVFVGDNTLIAVAMIFGAVLIVIGGNIAYESFTVPSARLVEKAPVKEKVEEPKPEKKPEPEEEPKELIMEELKELEAEEEPEVSALPETPDEELVELLPKEKKAEAAPLDKIDEMEFPEDEEPFRCPICKTSVPTGVSECPNCGTLFED